MDGLGETLLAFKGVAAGAWLAALFAAERLRPAVPFPQGKTWAVARPARNLGFLLISAAVSLAIVVPVSRAAAELQIGFRPPLATGATGLVLDLLLLDFLIYWWHRANHRVPFLWRFHEVHHRDRHLDATTALRFHFGEVAISACARAVVIILLAIPLGSVILFEILLLVATVFHHSNWRIPPALEARLAPVIITPSRHWVHHHNVRADTDSTYGTIFSFWDPLFGTTTPTQRAIPMPLGVEGKDELPLAALLQLRDQMPDVRCQKRPRRNLASDI